MPTNRHSRVKSTGAIGFQVNRPRNPRHRLTSDARRGVETLEAILTLPILLVATMAVLEFGLILLVQQAIAESAVAGAREAAKGISAGADQSDDIDAIAEKVQDFLAVHDVTFNTMGTNSTDNARVIVEDGSSGMTLNRGDTSLDCSPRGNPLDADQVRVTVCVEMSVSEEPVPNWLSTFGFTLAGRIYEVSALATFE